MAGELRITGGALARRRIAVPAAADRGALRPTSDKVRAAMMNALGARLQGARVLDAFAGSGALGFEALSRGATRATFVERDRRSADVIRDSADALALAEQVDVIADDVARVVRRLPAEGFEVVFADPPYALTLDALLPDLGRLVATGGLLVLERDRRAQDDAPQGFGIWRDRRYGDTRVVMYAKGPVEEDSSDERE